MLNLTLRCGYGAMLLHSQSKLKTYSAQYKYNIVAISLISGAMVAAVVRV